ncbi:PilN domain-containing protein [Patescibacteria group bacterium]|nr:PilN domain-containing protein [Patescibacteria group bacterium]
MEPKFQTSFIPKKPIGTAPGNAFNAIHTTNIFSLIATVAFLVAFIFSAALFAYKSLLTSQIKVAEQNVNTARASFQPEKIKDLVDANSRIMSSKQLLEKHVIVSEVLHLLQDLTVKKMKFSELTYVNKNDTPIITLKGEAQSFNALAAQQDIFNNSAFMRNPEFSGFVLVDNGNISVDFTSTLDPNLISYKKAVDEGTFNTQQ